MPNVTDLQKIELLGTEDLEKYITTLKNIFKDIKQEIDSSADQMQVILEDSMPNVDRFSSRMKARKVARQLRRAGDAAHRGMIHSVRTWLTYKREYEPKTPAAKKRTWKF